ncbi:MAG: TonB-dependent receptor, partial [Dysgonamonadaceae bacterium]|nr:TonB-dependent receptor [Dysgonamonadaceae bacterium]
MSVFRAFCLVFSLLSALLSPAQNRKDTILQLNELVVTANRYKEVIPAQTLKGEELEKLNSFSVADAIRFFAGVQ